jgi:type IV secretory pathway protease TraF
MHVHIYTCMLLKIFVVAYFVATSASCGLGLWGIPQTPRCGKYKSLVSPVPLQAKVFDQAYHRRIQSYLFLLFHVQETTLSFVRMNSIIATATTTTILIVCLWKRSSSIP